MDFRNKFLLKEEELSAVLDSKIKNPETGRNIKVSTALQKDDGEPVKEKAKQLVKKKKLTHAKETGKSQKKASRVLGVSKECVGFLKEKGFPKLTCFPNEGVKPEEILFNPNLEKLGKDNTWICKFPFKAPNGKVIQKQVYTDVYMKKQAKVKWDRISKLKPKDLDSIDKNSKRLLKNKDEKISDSACIINIIKQTGLRVGSLDESDTGNLGVRTLKKENITITNGVIKLKFLGKSSQINNATIKDSELAEYLTKKIESKGDKDNVFGVSYGVVDHVFNKLVKPKNISLPDMDLKDMRTYKATALSKELLQKSKLPPLPLPENPKLIKKQVKEKLQDIFVKVSVVLNNEAAMAKNSYVHPKIILGFLKSINVKPKEVVYKPGVDYLGENQRITSIIKEMEVEDDEENFKVDEMCLEYPLPDWWDDDNVELVPIKENKK